MYTAEVEARTIGARIHCPAVVGGSDPQRGDKVQPGVNPAVVAEMAAFPALSFGRRHPDDEPYRSAEHTSELQSLMPISSAVFCLQKNNTTCALPQAADRTH